MQDSLIYFRVYLEVNAYKNSTCFSRWSGRRTLDVNKNNQFKVTEKLFIHKCNEKYLQIRR